MKEVMESFVHSSKSWTRDLLRRSVTRAGRGPQQASFRSSKWFIQLTVGMAVFTDIFLYAIIIPVMPYALETRIKVEESSSMLNVQDVC